MKPAILLFVFAMLVGIALPALAADQVHITADRFVIEEGANLATFSGKVVVVQGTVTIKADTVEVHYGDGGAADIKSLVASGHLVITTPSQHVTGQRGTYDPASRVMLVTGNVVAETAAGRVTGSELRVDFKSNTTEFATENGGRVTGVFNQ